MSAKRITYVKIGTGRSLVRNENKARSSSAEPVNKICLKNVIIRKSKENLLPKDKISYKVKSSVQKLRKLDLNIKDVNNSFFKRLCEVEPKLAQFENSYKGPEDFISPVKSRY